MSLIKLFAFSFVAFLKTQGLGRRNGGDEERRSKVSHYSSSMGLWGSGSGWPCPSRLDSSFWGGS